MTTSKRPAPASSQHQSKSQSDQGVACKKGQRQHQGAAAFGQAAPTARAVLEQIAAKLRMGGAKLPMTVTAEPSTPESLMASGLSTALCLVEVELDALVAAAPRENPAHCALFRLPPTRASAETAIVVPAVPPQEVVTGDLEVDAVLWLRKVISTGNASLIEQAKAAALQIETPLGELEKRYAAYLARANPGHWAAGFADLDALAIRAIEQDERRQEARARFGDTIFEDTPAEQFCEQALAGLESVNQWYELDAEQVDERFDARLEPRPGTLMQCVYELTFWSDLYWLRNAVDRNSGDYSIQVNARQDYVFRMLARIPPRDADEAADVFRYLTSNDGMDRSHSGSIVLNLIGAPEPYNAHKGGTDE